MQHILFISFADNIKKRPLKDTCSLFNIDKRKKEIKATIKKTDTYFIPKIFEDDEVVEMDANGDCVVLFPDYS